MSVILFDMDGTLVDTEPIYQKLWMQAAADFGVQISSEMALGFCNKGRKYAQSCLGELTGSREYYVKIRDRRRAIMQDYLREHGLSTRPYVRETLAELHAAGHYMAVVSESPVERIDEYLRQTGIREYFRCLVSPQFVKEGKPAPDVYLYACEQIQVAPGEAYAVEDAPNGILSALTAGCRTIMVPNMIQPDEEWRNQLYAIAADFRDLPGLIS